MVEQFYLPGSKIQNQHKKDILSKNLNFQYLQLIFGVKKFRKDFNEYLENQYDKCCRKERKKKLIFLCKKFLKQHSFENLKLPWSNKEIEEAESIVSSLIHGLNVI